MIIAKQQDVTALAALSGCGGSASQSAKPGTYLILIPIQLAGSGTQTSALRSRGGSYRQVPAPSNRRDPSEGRTSFIADTAWQSFSWFSKA